MRQLKRLACLVMMFAVIFNGNHAMATTNGESQYDVIVVGGEPEGVAAAVSAARNGAKTLLVEKRDGLGGVMTYGKLNFLDVGLDHKGNPTSAGIYKEWHDMVGGSISFDVQDAKAAFTKLVEQEDNLTVMLNSSVKDVVKKDQSLSGLLVEQNGNLIELFGKRFIDCTQDGDLAALAEVPYFIGGKDIGLTQTNMAVTLMIHLKGVDWDGIRETADAELFGAATVNKDVAWGFSKLHTMYKPYDKNVRLRGLNIARQDDDSIYINALQIFGIDGLDEASKAEAIKRGKQETKKIVHFLRNHFPGFEHAEIASFPEELYVRETRHVLSEYQLPIADVWENRDHWDQIAIASYPVDVQATSIDDYGIVVTNPKQYSIPFRSIVPRKIDGLLVASRSSGYTSVAAGSARVIPTGMAVAEAAGVAAVMSINEDISFRKMTDRQDLITELQAKLISQGANLYRYELTYPYKGEWFYPGLKPVMKYGLLKGGYQNNIKANQIMEEGKFQELLVSSISRVKGKQLNHELQRLPFSKPLTRDRAVELLLILLGENELVHSDNPWKAAIIDGWINDELMTRLFINREITRAEGLFMIGNVISQLEKRSDL